MDIDKIKKLKVKKMLEEMKDWKEKIQIESNIKITGYYPEKYPKDWTCGCGVRSPYKEDCYFYHAEPSMGGCISCCSLHKGLGNCPCKNCAKFLSKSDAFKIILNYVNKEACK